MRSPTASGRAPVAAALAFTTFALVTGITPARAQTLETLVHFQCSALGCAPNGVLVQAGDGFFYGTTSEADYPWTGDGTVFRMDRNGTIQVLLTPARAFFAGADGLLYGTTPSGGAFDAGTIYRMNTDGDVTELYSFDGTTGVAPDHLVQAADGSFYGLVSVPGEDRVRLFHIDADRNVIIMRPRGDAIDNVRMMLVSRHGFMYGTTYGGTVYRINRNGVAHELHTFPTVYIDIMESSDGFFYGATIDGGEFGAGMIFRISRGGQVRVLHSFTGGAGGASPYNAPIEARDGYFYGTTGGGGAYDAGTVYRMDRNGQITVLHSFGESPEAGVAPVGDIVQGSDGTLYGTTVRGGAYDHGTAFQLSLPE